MGIMRLITFLFFFIIVGCGPSEVPRGLRHVGGSVAQIASAEAARKIHEQRWLEEDTKELPKYYANIFYDRDYIDCGGIKAIGCSRAGLRIDLIYQPGLAGLTHELGHKIIYDYHHKSPRWQEWDRRDHEIRLMFTESIQAEIQENDSFKLLGQ